MAFVFPLAQKKKHYLTNCFGLLISSKSQLYSSCEVAYRLTQTGKLNVPPEYADSYCGGPCLVETHLVLSCIENIMKHFVFYNKATIEDIRDTIKAGCGYGPERGILLVYEVAIFL